MLDSANGRCREIPLVGRDPLGASIRSGILERRGAAVAAVLAWDCSRRRRHERRCRPSFSGLVFKILFRVGFWCSKLVELQLNYFFWRLAAKMFSQAETVDFWHDGCRLRADFEKFNQCLRSSVCNIGMPMTGLALREGRKFSRT